MSQPNPYQTPHSFQPPVLRQPAPHTAGGLWRQGKLLVLHKNAPLLDICLKSNEPASRRLRRNLSWHHPAIALSILAGLLIYVILALILTKRATIHMALSERWFAIRRKRIAIAWAIVLGSIAIGIGGIVLANAVSNRDPGGWICLSCFVAFVVFFVGLLYGQYGARLVRPVCITDHYVYLAGVHPGFLAKLPEWPYPSRI